MDPCWIELERFDPENAGQLGLPIPQKMKDVLEQLHDKSEGDSDDVSEDEEEGE